MQYFNGLFLNVTYMVQSTAMKLIQCHGIIICTIWLQYYGTASVCILKEYILPFNQVF